MKTYSPSAALKKALETALLLGFLLVIASPVSADEQPIDLFSGFDDQAPAARQEESDRDTPSFLSGFAKLAAAYNTDHGQPLPGQTDWRGLSKLRGELLLETKQKLSGWQFFVSGKGFYDLAYESNGRSGYAARVLADYEDEVELREAWLQGALLPSLDLKLGRQIVAWGRSDNFRVTDILNPLDNREPGLTDIEDLRLPLAMTKLNFYLGDWSLDLIGIHEHRYDKNPPFGHDFYPYPVPPPEEIRPAHTMENTELALDLTGSFSGWDLSIYYADTFNDQPNLVPSLPPVSEHRRLKIFGTAASIARGNMLIITEAAHLQGLGFLADFNSDYERTDLLAGFEYSGFSETVINCDYLFRRLHGYNNMIKASPESPLENDEQLALRISRNFLHETVSLGGLAMVFGDRGQRGALERLTLTYDPADNWSITAGAVFYESGDTPATAIGDKDRVFMEIRYDF
ncbi:MAG: DUF1302 family protein [Thermodesulfobacteriota bacterium]